jgi:hypothetical protein
MGLLGGTVWHFGKGVRNSPKGSTTWTRTLLKRGAKQCN